MVMTAVIMSAVIAIVALSVDMGIHYYLASKLQNAVDSAATAVAQDISATNDSLEDIAYEYLADNGFDREGKYKDKITVKVVSNPVLSNTTVDDEDYITTNYYKITASVKDSSLFAKAVNIDSFSLTKTAYSKCDADYTTIPRALNYTIFGASSDGLAYGTVHIDDKTSETFNDIVNIFQGAINGINSGLIQPIIGIFGGDPDFKNIVNINTSEVVTNANVHTNSNLFINVQALNTSRILDADFYNGTVFRNGGEYKFRLDEISQANSNEFDNYGQVMFSIATKGALSDALTFSQPSHFTGDQYTHLYVQNQQYLKTTQLVLNALNNIEDFDTLVQGPISVSDNGTMDENGLTYVGNDDNGVAFLEGVDAYLRKQGSFYDEETGKFTETGIATKQRIADEAVKGNLSIDENGTILLNNQGSIVYDVDYNTANKWVADISSKEGLAQAITKAEDNWDKLKKYDSVDNRNDPSQTTTKVMLSKTNETGKVISSRFVSISGNQYNRDLKNLSYAPEIKDTAPAAAKSAVASVFQATDYISIPNMKPYFVRQIESSLYNATQESHKNELGENVIDKEGVKGVKSELVPMKQEELQEIQDKTYYTDQTYANYNYDEKDLDEDIDLDDLEVSSFNDVAAGDKLFSEYKASASSGLTDLTKNEVTYTTTDWTMDKKGGMSTYGDGRTSKNRTWKISSTSFKGYDLKNDDGSLRNSNAMIGDFESEHITNNKYDESTVLYGAKAIEQFTKFNIYVDDDHDDWKTPGNTVVTDFENHYGAEAIAKKRIFLEENISFDGVQGKYSNFEDYAPSTDDVFLKNGSVIKNNFTLAINGIKDKFAGLEFKKELDGTHRGAVVDKPEVSDPDESALVIKDGIKQSISDPALQEAKLSFKKVITADGISDGSATDVEKNYYMEDLFPGYDGVYGKDDDDNDTTVESVVNKYFNDHSAKPKISVTVPDPSTYAIQSSNFSGSNKQDQYEYTNSQEWYELKNDSAFLNMYDNPWYRHALFGHDAGVHVAENYRVFFTKGVRMSSGTNRRFQADNGSQTYITGSFSQDGRQYTYYNTSNNLTIGNNATFYIGGSACLAGGPTNVGTNSTLYIEGDVPWKKDRAMYIGDRSSLYIGGNAAINGDAFSIGSDAKCYIGGSLDTNNLKAFDIYSGAKAYFGSIKPSDDTSDCSMALHENAVVYVDGNLKVNNGHTLILKQGAILVVKGELDATTIQADKGSTIYCGSMNGGNATKTHTISNFLCPRDISLRGALTFTENANVFVNGNLIVDKTLTINNYDRLAIWGQPTVGSFNFNNNTADNIGFYAHGDYNKGDADLSIPGNTSFCFNNVSAKNISVAGQGGQLCVTGTCTSSGNITNSGYIHMNKLVGKSGDFTGSITNNRSMTINSSINPSSISNIGLFKVDGDITTNGDITSIANTTIENENSDLRANYAFLVTGAIKKVKNFTNIGDASVKGGINATGNISNGDESNHSRVSILYVGVEGESNVSVNCNNFKNYYKTRIQGTMNANGTMYHTGVYIATVATNCFGLESLSHFYTQDLSVNGDVTNRGTMVIKDISITGAFTNGSDSSDSAKVTVNGPLSVGSMPYSRNLFVDGNITFTGTNPTFETYNAYIGGSIVAGNGATSRPAVTVENILKVEGGASVSSFVTNENTNAVIGGTLSVYSTTGSTVLENNGNLKINGEISANAEGTIAGNAALTNRNIIQATNVNCLSLVNNGEDININKAVLIATGYINVKGDLNNGAAKHKTDTIFTDKYLYVEGNLVNYGLIGVDGADTSGHAVMVTGDITLYNSMSNPNGDLYCGGTITDKIEDSTIYVAQNENFILDKKTADDLLKTSKVIEVDGNMIIDSDITNEIEGLIIGGGTVLCKSENLELNYLTIDKTGTFSTDESGFFDKYNVKIKDVVPGTTCSIENYGKCYIDGDLFSSKAINAFGGELYVNGDVTVDVWYAQDALRMQNIAKVYINGWVTLPDTSNTDVNIVIDELAAESKDNSVLSIYGNGHNEPFNSANKFLFSNKQKGAMVYLGTGTDDESKWKNSNTVTINPIHTIDDKNFYNNGTMYVYGGLDYDLDWSDGRTVSYNNDGGTYVAGSFNCDYSAFNIANNHTFVVSGNFSSKAPVNVHNSKIYLMSDIDSSARFNIDTSTFFAANSYNYENGTNTFVNSTVYIPEPEKGHTVKYSDLSAKSSRGITGIITEADVEFDKSATIGGATVIYVGGNSKLTNGAVLTVNGGLYLMGSVDVSGASTASNPFVFNGGCDAFIGKTVADTSTNSPAGTLTFRKHLELNGTVCIENNVKVLGNNGKATVGNRYATLIANGKADISGDLVTADGQGVLINSNAEVACGGDLEVGSAIYNYGKFIAFGSLKVKDNDYVTDKKESKKDDKSKHHQGYSLKNGASESDTSALFYIGGTDPVTFYGIVRNSGQLYINSSSLSVQGWSNDGDVKGDQAFINYNQARAYFGGHVYLNSNVLYNRDQAVFSCDGDLYFGGCIYNLGTLVATGKITNNESGKTVNNLRYSNGSSKSIMNGVRSINYDEYNKHVYPNALIYCGGDLQLGVTQQGGEAGSYVSFGTTYVGGDLLEYTNTGNSFYKVALWLMNNSNTFVGGDCFGGGGILTGNNSIFMCDGDFVAKRSTKINVNMFVYYYATVGVVNHTLSCNDDDNFTPAYFYVGGNMFANVLGKVIWDYNTLLVTSGESHTPQNYSRDLDIFSNTNMFVGGALEVNAKTYIKQNVNLIVAGAKKLNETSVNLILGYTGHETVFNYILNAITDSGTRSALKALNDAGYFGDDPLTYYSAQLIDQNVCSTFVVNGDATVIGTTKIRDMAKTYIYGSFYSRNYVELGKALDGMDETEAKENGFFVDGVDSDEAYSYSRAAYMYVGGNYQCGGSQRLGKKYQELTGVLATLTLNREYTKIFASSTLKVKGSFFTTDYLTLRHDANIYSGKSLSAFTSIDVGSYSGVYVNGNLEAISSNLKIRDQVECTVSGDMTAVAGYIELGKQGDFERGKKATTVSEGSNKETCECCTDCTDNIFCECSCDNCKWKDASYGDSTAGSGSDGDSTGSVEIDKPVATDTTEIADVSTEINYDASDLAYGSKFFIGGKLLSYNLTDGYIKVFGYSEVIVGKFVFTPQYLTLRHNSDLYVLPEMFDNITYKYKPYVSTITDDANIWQKLVDAFRRIGYEVGERTKLKNGSVYTLGQITMNKNSSVLATYDLIAMGQATMLEDTLIYVGHDFTCYAPSVNMSSVVDRVAWEISGKEGKAPDINVTGFTAQGAAEPSVRMVCTNTAAHEGRNHSMRVLKTKYNSSKNYVCDECGAELNKKYFDENSEILHPITVYAANDITLSTTVQMSSTYLVADMGDVKIGNVYSSNECHCCDGCSKSKTCQCTCYDCICGVDLRSLPNAIASYQGNIDYDALYSKISALFYAPSGNVALDGFYQEIWGSIIGNTVDTRSFYLAMHRFENWKTMNLHIAQSGDTYIISKKEFDKAKGLTVKEDDYDRNNLNGTTEGGADRFFPHMF